MRAAYLDEARQDQVAHAVRDVLHRRGALIRDHTSSRVLFQGYRPSGRWTWDRGGYVGIYQHTGEKEVEVRLLLRARWPFRLLWGVALANVVAVLLAFALRVSGTGMFAIAATCAFALLVAAILYVNTWRPVRREERDLMEAFETHFTAGVGPDDVETEEERERRLFEERVAGEIERKRVDELRRLEPAPERRPVLARVPRPSFKLGRKAEAPPPDPDAEEKRARLAALKAQVEARRGAAAAPAPEASEPAPAKRGFSFPRLGRKKDAEPPAESAPEAPETPEARKARLLARKAELEARKKGGA